MVRPTYTRRVRTGAPSPRRGVLALTRPDYVMFEAIERHGPLSSSYLYAFTRHLRRDRTHLQNRLTEFYNGDIGGAYLTRPPQQFASYCGRHQHVVYDLAPRAIQVIAEHSALPKRVPTRSDPFVHRLMTACVGASFELTAPTVGLRYISLQEILDRPSCGGARAARNPLSLPVGLTVGSEIVPIYSLALNTPAPVSGSSRSRSTAIPKVSSGEIFAKARSRERLKGMPRPCKSKAIEPGGAFPTCMCSLSPPTPRMRAS